MKMLQAASVELMGKNVDRISHAGLSASSFDYSRGCKVGGGRRLLVFLGEGVLSDLLGIAGPFVVLRRRLMATGQSSVASAL